MQTISRSKGRPKGKSSCGNCTGCKKKRKCLNKFKLNLNSDALIASQVASPSHIREHTTKPSLGKKLRSNFNINKVNNPSGHNQWSKLDNKENIDPIKCGKKRNACTEIFNQATIGANLSERYCKKLRFSRKISECGKSRQEDFKHIANVVVKDVLGQLTSDPAEAFQYLNEANTKKMKTEKLIDDSTIVRNIKSAYQNAPNFLERRKLLSLYVGQYTLRDLKYKVGLNISRHAYAEARFHAKAWGPGGAIPEFPYGTAPTKEELLDVVLFCLNPSNATGLAFGERSYINSLGERVTVPNFQRTVDPEKLYSRYQAEKQTQGIIRYMKRSKFLYGVTDNRFADEKFTSSRYHISPLWPRKFH